jgi:hypothetical protein
MLRWIFVRHGHALTCEVDARTPHTFDVSVVPHWDVSSAVVERYDHAVTAMERHAGIAADLRAAGWVLVRHAAADQLATAA